MRSGFPRLRRHDTAASSGFLMSAFNRSHCRHDRVLTLVHYRALTHRMKPAITSGDANLLSGFFVDPLRRARRANSGS